MILIYENDQILLQFFVTLFIEISKNTCLMDTKFFQKTEQNNNKKIDSNVYIQKLINYD